VHRDDILAYYAARDEHEWARLTTPETDGVVEFVVNTRTIARYLPPGARVLDIGGGPGRYALWLAAQGHRVVLADLSPALLAIARRQVAESPASSAIEAIVEADACDLSRWPDVSFDAALSFGPFYHLIDAGERDRAAAELARVTRPGGYVFVALMPYLALLRRTLALPDERRHLGDPAFVTALLDHGIFQNDIPWRFTSAYGARVEAVAPFFTRHGFTAQALLASEGFTAGLGPALADLAAQDPHLYEAALDLAVRTAAEPSILGLCNHLLYVGRRNG
jgi:SAM-dependent methyltransferase